MKYHSKPNPADAESIKKWELIFEVSMPDDLKIILLESNGPIFYSEDTGKELQLLSVTDAIEYYEAYKFPEYCINAIPISMDGSGNFVVYKKVEGTIETVYAMSAINMGWHDAVQLRSTISEVISMERCIEEILFS